MPRISASATDFFDVDFKDDLRSHKLWRDKPAAKHDSRATRPSRRADGTEEFKCGHCRAFIGPTMSGGRHRNHCPLCLFSKHVDRSRPGDRLSGCRSLMQPIGVACRPNGEQMIVHRCLGCGAERRNRVAADDNVLACMRLAPVATPKPKELEEQIA